ncbi:MAG: Nucleotidyltransferase domain protein [Syntrophorhabdus sp. PtaB.Bin047]|nr:MAG: Nucleotidyltransferase domain protein [Syntrophorhabdus sp. PtaB.Bin047]
MEDLTLKSLVDYLQRNKQYLRDRFGVTRIGVFGSLVAGGFTPSSDIDVVVEMEEERKNLHSFLQLKRYLEGETSRKVDLGFEHALKPAVREAIRKRIIYV